MSTINNALSKLAEQQSAQSQQESEQTQTLIRATVSPIKSSRLVWAIGGFTLSLGLGAWAVSSAPEPIQTSVMAQPTSQAARTGNELSTLPDRSPFNDSQLGRSNTSKVVEPAHATIYEAPKMIEEKTVSAVPAPKSQPHVVAKPDVATSQPKVAQSKSVQNQNAPVLLASNNTPAQTSVEDSATSSMQVQQVELTHRQMADKALERANKAIEANDFATASTELQTALRYVPEDENTRRKLAALYYGNRQVRKSAELLEEGIKLNKNSNGLRMSLAGILVKEKQPEAALSALGYIPDGVSDKYLAMRAALAQQLKNNDWAKQSYQMLTQRDPENGRWWLGLGIQQERSAELSAAKESYTKALTMVGLSSQSQAFIRDRIAVLTALEQGDN